MNFFTPGKGAVFFIAVEKVRVGETPSPALGTSALPGIPYLTLNSFRRPEYKLNSNRPWKLGRRVGRAVVLRQTARPTSPRPAKHSTLAIVVRVVSHSTTYETNQSRGIVHP